MGEGQGGGAKQFDVLESFRGLRDIYLDAMAKTMVEAVNTEEYAKASGAILDSTLTMSAPMREGFEKSMLQVLQQLSLPSRQDIAGLAERFTNLEMRLDDMDAKLDRILNLVGELSRPVQQIVVPVPAGKPVAESAAPLGVSSPPTEPAETAVEASPVETSAPLAAVPPAATPKPAPRPKKVASTAKTARKGAK